jgi:hypothetical protein
MKDRKKPVRLERIELRGFRARQEITRAEAPMIAAIKEILEANRDFWPLSVRQVHYRLLPYQVLAHASKPNSVYRNTLNDYHKLTELLARARLAGLIPFAAIGDETRPVETWPVHKTVENFVREERARFLSGYWRDVLQSQPDHIEVIGEKLTIEGAIRSVCARYTVPYTIGRGFTSLDPRKKLIERFRASAKNKLVVLALSDFDPSGEEIAHSFVRSLRDDFGVAESQIEPVKVALTLIQVREFRLPPVMTAKETDPNYERFIERYADSAVHELDALEPAQLQSLLTRALDNVIDRKAYTAEIEAERRDGAFLDRVRQSVNQAIESLDLD